MLQIDSFAGVCSSCVGAVLTAAFVRFIVLEEVGIIASSHLISTGMGSNSTLMAENISSALRIMFVANEYSSGSKVDDASKGGWPTELILFDLEPSYDDELHSGDGSNVLIGQRGSDFLKSGSGRYDHAHVRPI